ncbi:MAG: ABC transporter ATP-binding protein [Parachlamydiaceae bacterium]|nr:ABC transporter ATP-binding protein [Parachlamydiaceae bacterium]
MTPIIELDHLDFGYQDLPVLNDVSFKIHAGDYVGIIGPNGGGKTTLLKLIMGFLKPTQGSIRVFGTSPNAACSQIAYVPQVVRFDRQFPISVLEVVLLGRLAQLPWYGRYREEDRHAACQALDKVGLLPLKDRAFGTLSGGQAQRTLIARALVSNPKLLLLDEPTASVDAQTQAEIYALLDQLQNEMTILMVTHDLNIAIEHVKRVICVQRQVILLTPQEVCEHFAMGLYHTPLINTISTRKV